MSQSLTASSGATSQCQKSPRRGAAAIFPRHHGHGGIFEGAAGIGVGTIDIGFERIAAEPSLAEVRWFRGGLLLDTGALDL